MVLSYSIDRVKTPQAREKLRDRKRIIWCRFQRGRSIGYLRRQYAGVWFGRIRLKYGNYRQHRIGVADDDESADGKDVLSFVQALKEAEEWCEENSDVAIEKVLAWEDRIEFPELPEAPPYFVGHALKAYLEWYRDHRRGFASAYYSSRASLFDYFWNIPLDDLTSTAIRRWMFEQISLPPRLRSRRDDKQQYASRQEDDPDYLRRRKASVNRSLIVLRAALFQALERGMIDSDAAWINVRCYRGVSRAQVNYLEKEQISALVKECPPRLAQLVSGAVLTGCRLGELRRMNVSAFDPNLRLLQVDDQKTKQIRKIYLAQEAFDFFVQLTADRPLDAAMFPDRNGRHWRKGTQWRPFKQACIKAGLSESFRFHELRHTYASHAVMAGVPLKVVATQLGHMDTRTVDRFYSRLGNEYVATVMNERMPTLLSKKTPHPQDS